MESKTKILIVDDIELNRAILSELFKDTYDILEAEDGEQAIELLTKHFASVAVMLLDIIMPVLDGFGVLEKMSAQGWIGTIPVVLITSETSEGAMQKGYEMGVTDIISKPFAPNIIRQRINNIVEQYTYKSQLEHLVRQQMNALRNQDKKLRENSAKMIDILSAVIEFKNSESVEHIRNIRTLTRLLLEKLASTHGEYELTEELIAVISEAAAMHDIGKVAIPDQILNKPGKLTAAEFEIMKTHAVRGCEILEKLSTVQYLDYYDYCYQICRHHHERWDGNGYPDGLAGDEIPIWAQVVSLADVYDALTSKRVYKDAYSDKTAVSMILAGECGIFNPQLIQCFLTLVPTLNRRMREELSKTPVVDEFKKADIKLLVSQEAAKEVSARTLHLLELERRKYRIMSELSEEILFDYDMKSDKLVFSEKFQTLTRQDPVLSHFKRRLQTGSFLYIDDISHLQCELRRLTIENPACKLEVRLDLDGLGFVWYDAYLYSIWDTEYEAGCIGYMGKLINIEKRKQANLKLQVAADTDPLTGILNRKALTFQISQLISNGQMSNGALCFLDIDNFKQLNDTFGHLFGDGALKRVSAILSDRTRKLDLVGRIGGDEFIVFFNGFSDMDSLEKRLSSICESLCRNFDDCRLSGSIGVACFPQHGIDFTTLLHRADQALYQAKLLGKNQYQIYQNGQKEFPDSLAATITKGNVTNNSRIGETR